MSLESEVAVIETKLDRLVEDVRCMMVRVSRLEKLVYMALGAILLVQFSPMLMDFLSPDVTYRPPPHGIE